MAKVLTKNTIVNCVHAGAPGTGVVQISASQQVLAVAGAPVLVGDDLTGKDIVGCTLTGPPGTKPCTRTTSMAGGGAARFAVQGTAVLLDTANGDTDSNPPGTWRVLVPGQTRLDAD